MQNGSELTKGYKYFAIGYKSQNERLATHAGVFRTIADLKEWVSLNEYVITTELADRPYVSTVTEYFPNVKLEMIDDTVHSGRIIHNWRHKRWELQNRGKSTPTEMADVQAIIFPKSDDPEIAPLLAEWAALREATRKAFEHVAEVILEPHEMSDVVIAAAAYHDHEKRFFAFNSKVIKSLRNNERKASEQRAS